MILVALGGNLETAEFGPPLDTLKASLVLLAARGIEASKFSKWYRTAPVPLSDQPWFVNAVAEVTSELAPEDLLAALHEVEARLGRERVSRWAARTVDLDLLAHGRRIRAADDVSPLELPHPRLHERAFVLCPLLDVAPEWRHPVFDKTALELYRALPADALDGIEPIPA